jgi:hypothetical protein
MAVIYKEIVIGRLPNGFAGDTPVCGFDAIALLACLGKHLQSHIIKIWQPYVLNASILARWSGDKIQ